MEAPLQAPPFTPAQENYLRGVLDALAQAGLLAPAADGGTSGGTTATEPTHHGVPVSELCQQERWKHEAFPLSDGWQRLLDHAAADKRPDAEHNFRFRWFGLFHVSPAQDSFMLRLRIPGGCLTAHQLRGIADLAADLGGGYAHITTRSNLQIREIAPRNAPEVLTRLQELGLTSKGSGADNIRNITASPDAGLAPDELLDVRPLARALHHYILNHPDLYDLPRKFNVSFDSGSSLSTAADTNDIGFVATRVLAHGNAEGIAPGTIGFRVLLGGITGHRDFARDCGLFVLPHQAVALAAAMIRVFAKHGNRTDRKKARLKYLLDDWGLERFVDETARLLAYRPHRLPSPACSERPAVRKHSWVGVYPQRQHDLHFVGLSIPVGRLEAQAMRDLAQLAERHGSGELRLTPWQNLLIPNVRTHTVGALVAAASRLGFPTVASPATDGIIACTGSRGCKYAAADTKGSAAALIAHLRGRIPELDTPVNLHFTGCSHSCAQHYCGDLGFIATKLPDATEGYHVVVGGGMDNERAIARDLVRNLPAKEVNSFVEGALRSFLAVRHPGESFHDFGSRHDTEALRKVLCSPTA